MEEPSDDKQLSGGIIPVMIHPKNRDVYVLLGEEVRLHPSGKKLEWSEFGGGRKYTDATIEQTAVREYQEECGGKETVESLCSGNYLAKFSVPFDETSTKFKTYFVVCKPWDATAAKRYNKLYEELNQLRELCKNIRKERNRILDRNRTAALPFVDQTFINSDGTKCLVVDIDRGKTPKTILVTGKTMAFKTSINFSIDSEDYDYYIDLLKCIKVKRAQCPELWEQNAVESKSNVIPFVSTNHLEKRELRLWKIKDILEDTTVNSVVRDLLSFLVIKLGSS
jgi:hypothetical protein